MKHLHTFESFLNEADTRTEVQETVEIKQDSHVGQMSPEYDLSPIIDALKTFKKPDVKTIVFDIPGAGTFTVDAAGHTTDATSSNLKKAIDQCMAFSPNNKFFNASGGQHSNLWYNKTTFERTIPLYLGVVLRAAYMYDIKWPIEVEVPDASDPYIAKQASYRKNSSFDPINNKEDFFIWLTTFPSVPIYTAVTQEQKGAKAAVSEVIGLSPKTIKVTITGMRSA